MIALCRDPGKYLSIVHLLIPSSHKAAIASCVIRPRCFICLITALAFGLGLFANTFNEAFLIPSLIIIVVRGIIYNRDRSCTRVLVRLSTSGALFVRGGLPKLVKETDDYGTDKNVPNKNIWLNSIAPNS